MVTCAPAWSMPPHFQEKMARWRSRDPSRVSASLPARGASAGGVVSHGHWTLADEAVRP